MFLILNATFMGVMTNIFYVIVALLILMFMIVVHEFGHYLAGKKLGFQINEFAIGFGPPIFKKKMKGGEQFSIRPIPLGGFCAFEGEETDEDNPKAFNNQAPWKRLIVLFSGAFFNFISAMIIISLFFCIYGETVSTVSTLYPDGVAIRENTVQEGDIILKVDGKAAHILLGDDHKTLLDKTGDTAKLRVLRDGKVKNIEIKKGPYTYIEPVSALSFYQYYQVVNNEYVGVEILPTDKLVKIGDKKVENMSAEKLKSAKENMASFTQLTFERSLINGTIEEINVSIVIIKEGDKLAYINDVFLAPLTDEQYLQLIDFKKRNNSYNGDVVYFIQSIENNSYKVPVVVSDAIYDFSNNKIEGFNASYLSEKYRYEGYNFGFTRMLSSEKLGFFRALGRSFTYSFFIVFKVLALLGSLLTGKMGLENAGGPITVISTISEGARLGGFQYLMFITCILSANLAVMNLLPLPALDGSKMVFTTIEWIRKKPINRKVEAVIHTVGLVILFTFTVFIDVFHMIK